MYKYTKEIKRPQADTIRIVVDVSVNIRDKIQYHVMILLRPYRKHTFFCPTSKISFQEVNPGVAEMREARKQVALEYVSQEELDQAIREAYESIAPNDKNVIYGSR